MKPLNYLRSIALFLALLIISLPITFAEEFNRVYDANGNLIADGKYYREYNGLNKLIKVRLGNTSTSPLLEEYLWHPIEERIVVKRVYYNSVYNYTVYYPSKEFVRIVNSSGTFDEKYVYQDGVLVAQIDTDGNKQFVHADHEGSNTLITDINGNVIENTFYSPYGEIISGGKTSRFDYEGKEYDSVVEDLDFNFRKYNPAIPIFNQPDTLIPNVYDPQSLNRFSFERNNPMKNTDSTGHIVPLIAIGIGIILIANVLSLGIMAIDWYANPQNRENIKKDLYLTGAATGASLIASEKIPNPYGVVISGTIEVGMVLYSGYQAAKDLWDYYKGEKDDNKEKDNLKIDCKLTKCRPEDDQEQNPKIYIVPEEKKSEEKNTAGSGPAGSGGGGGGCKKPVYCYTNPDSKSTFCNMC